MNKDRRRFGHWETAVLAAVALFSIFMLGRSWVKPPPAKAKFQCDRSKRPMRALVFEGDRYNQLASKGKISLIIDSTRPCVYPRINIKVFRKDRQRTKFLKARVESIESLRYENLTKRQQIKFKSRRNLGLRKVVVRLERE